MKLKVGIEQKHTHHQQQQQQERGKESTTSDVFSQSLLFTFTLFSSSHRIFFNFIFSFALHLPYFSFSRWNLNVNKIMNVYSNSIVWLLSCYYFNLEYGYGVRSERVYVLFTTPPERSLYQTKCACVCVCASFVPGYLTSPISVDRETDDRTVRVGMSVYNVRADDFTDRKLAFETYKHTESENRMRALSENSI